MENDPTRGVIAGQAMIFGDKGLAKYLNTNPTTPANWRRTGVGPRWIWVGLRCVAYRVADVEAWLTGRENMPLPPTPAAPALVPPRAPAREPAPDVFPRRLQVA